MAKKQFGKIAALAALAGAAVGITYFLRYKSFHEELEEDFHDFEEDLDEFDEKEEENAPRRNYVSLNQEKSEFPETELSESETSKDVSPDTSVNTEKEDFLDKDVEFLDDDPMFDETSSCCSSEESDSTTIVDDKDMTQ